jgi:antitoxin MazE
MKARIVRIGNSKGIRIPKPLIEQTGLKGDVEIEAQNGKLLIKPATKARAGWAESFKEMAKRGDDALILDAGVALTSFDEDEWEW